MSPNVPPPDTTAQNSDLLSRLRDGNPEAWCTVSGVFRKQLRQMAAATLPAELASRADASDIVQQTLADANESIAAFHGRSLPELFAWLAAILNNNANDAVRTHLLALRRTVRAESHLHNSADDGLQWDGVIAADQTSPSLAAVRTEVRDRLVTALESLPPRQRHAVRLRHLEGRPLAEIADQLGCNVAAAAALIARGLRTLRGKLHDLDSRSGD